MYKEGNGRVNKQLLSSTRGPDRCANFYKGYAINGFRFHTKQRETFLKTQNCGVVVKGDVLTGDVDYYGMLTKIIELEYMGKDQVVLFKCDWFDVPPKGRDQSRGYCKDEYGFISIDVTRT